MLLWNLCVFFFFLTSSSADYYDLLGISKDADNREIRRAFKKLALKLHPDKTQGKDTHDQFIAINKAYEVLKDEDTRKKYDLYGEEGLKDDFGSSWKGNYRSWNWYSESFGIYDDDPEIVTLNRHDFAQSVLESSELWFVNFYSPQCSHCHHLASTWRQLSLKLLDVIHIGAVNCEEDWMLCRQQNVHSYPSLMLYPRGEKYQGSRDVDSMVDFVLESLPDYTIKLNSERFLDELSKHDPLPWLIFFCDNLDSSDCYDASDLKMLSIVLKNLVFVAKVPKSDTKMCEMIHCTSQVAFYPQIYSNGTYDRFQDLSTFDLEMRSLLKTILELLPDPEELSDERLKSALDFKNGESIPEPMLVQFTRADIKSSAADNELKRLKQFLPEVWLGYFDCKKHEISCSSLYIKKYPTFIFFKGQGSYEFFYGRISVHDVVQFTKEVLLSQVQTLTPDKFPGVTQDKDNIWFIDFFAPWCPPCMELLPQWRKASQSIHHKVKFGTVDCSTHVTLCRQNKVNSYPTTILYNDSIPHRYDGLRSHTHIVDFVEDILHPSVTSLSPELFQDIMRSKKKDEIWVIDFFAPWCGPCQQLAPQWRKLAKMMKSFPFVHIGEVNCQLHHTLCNEMMINSYPTIRLYPRQSSGAKNFFVFNGRSRDAASLQGWIYDFLPTKVELLGGSTFRNVLTDTQPWIVDFYAPWCGHCVMFAPEFEKIAHSVEGKVKTGKVNCDHFPDVCNMAGIRSFPTVLFYEGSKGQATQNPVGEEIDVLTYKAVLSFLDTKVELNNNQDHYVKDEL